MFIFSNFLFGRTEVVKKIAEYVVLWKYTVYFIKYMNDVIYQNLKLILYSFTKKEKEKKEKRIVFSYKNVGPSKQEYQFCL